MKSASEIESAIKDADVFWQSLNKYEKLLWFYAFHYCVLLVYRIQVCVTKIQRPKKEMAGNLPDSKKLQKFWEK